MRGWLVPLSTPYFITMSPRSCLIRIYVYFLQLFCHLAVWSGSHFSFLGPGFLSGERSLPFDLEGTSGSNTLCFSEVPFQAWCKNVRQDQNVPACPFPFSLPVLNRLINAMNWFFLRTLCVCMHTYTCKHINTYTYICTCKCVDIYSTIVWNFSNGVKWLRGRIWMLSK